jgi:hypothetical protein
VAEEAAVVAISLEGVMNPMAASALKEVGEPVAPEPPASAPSRPQPYREASCGTVSLYPDAGERLSTVRDGRMPERKNATFCEHLHAECQSLLALRPALQGVKLADGAEDNGRFLDALALGRGEADLARGEQIASVDFYHAAEHLGKACDVIWGAQSVQSKAECAPLRTLLTEDDRGVDKGIARLRYRASGRRGRKREAREKELTYCRNQRQRRRYAQ